MIRRGPIRLHPIDAIDALAPSDEPQLAALQKTASWARSYLTSGHPQIGRMGPVCPWCPASINQNIFWIGALPPGAVEGSEELDEAILALRDDWYAAEPREGKLTTNRTFLLVVPDDGPEGDAVLAMQERFKPSYLERGLMFGEFFPLNDKRGIRSDDFFPLRSPIPLLVVREMVALDIAFLSDEASFPHFERVFGEDAPKHLFNALHPRGKPFTESVTEGILAAALRHRASLSKALDGVDPVMGLPLEEPFRATLAEALAEDRGLRPLWGLLKLRVRVQEGPERITDAKPIVQWKVSRLVRRLFRTGDLLGRTDQGDFLVALSIESPAGVARILERIESVLSTSTLTIDGELRSVHTEHLELALESVADPMAPEWAWDGTVSTEVHELFAGLSPASLP